MVSRVALRRSCRTHTQTGRTPGKPVGNRDGQSERRSRLRRRFHLQVEFRCKCVTRQGLEDGSQGGRGNCKWGFIDRLAGPRDEKSMFLECWLHIWSTVRPLGPSSTPTSPANPLADKPPLPLDKSCCKSSMKAGEGEPKKKLGVCWRENSRGAWTASCCAQRCTSPPVKSARKTHRGVDRIFRCCQRRHLWATCLRGSITMNLIRNFVQAFCDMSRSRLI